MIGAGGGGLSLVNQCVKTEGLMGLIFGLVEGRADSLMRIDEYYGTYPSDSEARCGVCREHREDIEGN